MKKRVLPLTELLLSLGFLPLWFAKLFHGVGHLPDAGNPDTIVAVDFYHSLYENIMDGGFAPLFPLSVGLLAVSAMVSVIVLICPNRIRWQTAGHLLFGLAVGVFALSLILASTVGRGY